MKNICASIAEIGELAFAPILFMLNASSVYYFRFCRRIGPLGHETSSDFRIFFNSLSGFKLNICLLTAFIFYVYSLKKLFHLLN